ncbi:MAG: carboxypeptidase regulatory-like domain-containing protein [Planctomycetaceae bacterium]|nr:carboxypeptidase regulatory-like domain-containing protein [Planctomycetaceae bacterium]
MRKTNFFAQIAACAAGLGLLLPGGAIQAANTQVAKSVRQISSDVILTNGSITGQYLTSAGTAVEGAVVSVRQGGQEVARTMTNANGVFVVSGVNSGVYEIATAGGVEVVRAWESTVAPPSAQQFATIVVDDAVRGQCDDGCASYACGGGGSMIAGLGVALGVAGLAVGIVGIAKATDAEDEADALRDRIDDLEDRIEMLESP